MPAYLLAETGAPEKAHRFPDVRLTQRVAELFQTFLAIESVVNQRLEDDLHLGALHSPPPIDFRVEDPEDDDARATLDRRD